MSPGTLEKVFDPFFSTKEPGKGTGLGLSTTRSIVKKHGGFIQMESALGRGSSFMVFIPAVQQAGADAIERVPEGLPMGEGELILIVDDETPVREITKQILESCGYATITAGDGTEALALYAEKQGVVRVVLTDMAMPYMDGAATIRALRKIDPRARIIATSGMAAAGQEREALSLGVDSFLAKPYTAETLLGALRDVLGRGDGS
jgi:CheY-like chemotaxis protein